MEESSDGSELEKTLLQQIYWIHLPPPELEFRFAKPRRWRFDFCWPRRKLAVEIEGGTYSQGRHVRGDGFEKDCEKYNEAAIAGYCVLRVTGKMVKDGRAIGLIERVMKGK